MKQKVISLLALFCAFLAIALQLESRARLEQQVKSIAEERERIYCSQLATKLNMARELVGLKPVAPKNFAEVLNSWFESTAAVMNGVNSNRADPNEEKKK